LSGWPDCQDITEQRQAEQALEERARQLVLINDISRQVTNVIELDRLLDTTATLIQQNFGYDHVGIFIADPGRDELVLRAKAGEYAAQFPAGHRMKMGQGLIGWVARHGERLLANDVSTEPRFYNPLSEDIIRAELDVPIKAGGELLGVLGVQSRHINAFTDNDIVVIETLADQVAIAIDNAWLFATERDQRTFAQALADSASALNSTLDRNEVLDRILDNVGRVLPHDARTIMLVEGDVARVVSHSGYAERGLGELASHVKFRIAAVPSFAEMARTGQSICVLDTRDYAGWLPNEAAAWVRSYIGAPIRFGEDLLGFINLESSTPGYFNQEQAGRLQAFADQVPQPSENAKLYHELESYSEFLEQAVEERTAQLRATTDRVETILSSVGDALIVLHLDGRIQQVNPAFERQTGYRAVEVELQDCYDLLGLDFGSKGDYLGALEGLRPGEVWQHQATVKRQDGSTYEADFTIAPVRDDGGSIRLLVVSIRDITPLKAAQRAKDEFVSNVSHELRTPITGIKLSYSLLSMNPERSDVYMERMGREINRLNELIEDLLRLTRLEQGHVELALALSRSEYPRLAAGP
jgi:PAS domain S-box-containing protein